MGWFLSPRALWCFVIGGMDVTYSKCGFISLWWCATQGGHKWLICPLRQDSFVKSFSCQNEASALFSCCSMAWVMSQSTWEGGGPGKHGVWKWRRAVVMDALSSLYRTQWHMFNLSPAAPVDRAGWDFTPLWSCVCACVWVSERKCKI